MGKRKTNTELLAEEQETNTPQTVEVSQNNSTAIKYSGKVTVKLQQGNRILSSRQSTNSGGESMFKFIAYCLAGDYSVAEELRPCKVMLFHNDEDTPAGAKATTGNASLCNFKYTENKSIPANTSTETAQWSTTYHFRIPYAWIRGNKNINTVCLYGKNAQVPENTSLGDYAAWYQFTDGTGNNWVPIETANLDNTNIIIDWTVSIENK